MTSPTLDTMSMNVGFSDAPPTKNPSMFGFVINSWTHHCSFKTHPPGG